EDGAASHPVDRLLDENLVPGHAGIDRIWGGANAAPPPDPPTAAIAAISGLLEDALELELAAHGRVRLHDLEAGHGVVVPGAVGVEAPLAVDAVEVLGQRDGLAHGLALLGGILGLLDGRSRALDAVDGDAARFDRIEGVGGGLLAVLLLVVLVGLGADPLHLLEG